jgi:hypothetical protein
VTTGRGRGGWEEGLCKGLGEGGIVAAVLVDSVFCPLEEICHGLHSLPHPLAHLYTKKNEKKFVTHRLSHPLAHRYTKKYGEKIVTGCTVCPTLAHLHKYILYTQRHPHTHQHIHP